MHHNNIYKTRASLQKKIAVIICGLFFSIILLEIGIRLGGLILLYRQEYRNAQAIKQNGVYRIMCLGESTTAGQYPGPLEDILNKRNVGIRFSVIDKGIVGINTVVILSQLQQNLDTYKPNMVIVMAGNNDMGIKYYKGIPEVNATVFRHWRIYRLMRLLYMRIIKKLKKQDIYGLALLKPENDNNYLKLGRLYQTQGKYPQAEELFKKAIELSPKNDDAYSGLGHLYQTQGKYPQAEELFKKAIELNPGNNFAYIGLGWIYRVQGEYSKAEELFKKIISLYPENYRAYGAMSVLYEEMGEPELAKGYTGNAANGPRLGYYNPVTVNSYRKFKEILSRRGIRLVCVQYPMRSLGPLRKIFENDEKGVIFVDNERVFKEAVKKEGFGELFLDMSGGDFGHCTKKGNALLAENIANVILTEAFSK
jgi:tetratricopeptide (TPR) repeat protein